MPVLKIEEDTINFAYYKKDDVSFVKIYLDDLNGVSVTAHTDKSEEDVKAFLRKKKNWLDEKWKKLHLDLYTENELKENAKIAYLGRKYKLNIEETTSKDPGFTFHKGKFKFTCPHSLSKNKQEQTFTQLMENWLQKKAEEKFPQLYQGALMENDQYRLGVKTDSAIYLNWRLVKRSKQEISKVIEDLKQEKTY
ncbi:YgjP-like metallopeptidase domain-containing protein [Halobacillus campisalis]|uniref:YgjP-like metallopeptidase domain-containing protein n=1 Tax=Halobacillus campisalis TaxID=435909 RepID=A0ABW2K3R3_9BACI|nr:YgjP-like metallopeptidase domain-containing protein [Halobacillus campisalis]